MSFGAGTVPRQPAAILRITLVLASVLLVAACEAPASASPLFERIARSIPLPLAGGPSGEVHRIDCGSEQLMVVETEATDPSTGRRLLQLSDGQDWTRAAYHPVPQATAAVVWLSGADGGLDGPFGGFYAELAADAKQLGLASLRLEYREPTNLEPSVCETGLALTFLEQQGIEEVILVGFSFGGAVAIDAAGQDSRVGSVVTLASQSLGTDRVGAIAPRPLVVIQPENDEVIPSWAAEDIFDRAGEPKELIVLPTDDHYLSDSADDVEELVLDHLRAYVSTQLGGEAKVTSGSTDG